MRAYFTSDLHIGHDKDFVWAKRGFSSIEEHDSFILDYWSRTVTYDDIVVLVGDFVMGKSKIERAFEIIERMPFKDLLWICGNHDHPVAKMAEHIGTTTRSVIVRDMGEPVSFANAVVSHFPPGMIGEHKEDRHRDYSKYAPKLTDGDKFVHGHTHSDKFLTQVGDKTLIHVGWDTHHGFVELIDNDFVQPQKDA